MITVTFTKNGPRIAGLKAEAKGARRLLARVRDYREWRAAERPNNQAKHMRKRVITELRKLAKG